jgi:hypothetical protein
MVRGEMGPLNVDGCGEMGGLHDGAGQHIMKAVRLADTAGSA